MKTFVAAILLVAVGFTSAQNSISFFDENSNLLHTSTLVSACEKLPQIDYNKKYRYVSTEACVILYSSRNGCDESSRHLPVNPTDTKYDFGNMTVSAFRPCANQTGEYQDIRMEVHGNRGLLHDMPIEFNEKNCGNLPNRVVNEASRISAPYCMILFDEENCEGGRVRQERVHMDFYEMTVKSYSLCDKERYRIVPDVPTVNAKVVGAVFTVADNAMDVATKKKLSIEGSELFENNGSVPVKQLHKFKKSVEQVLEMERLESLLSFDSMNTSSDATLRSADDIPTFAMDKIRESFKKAYSRNSAVPKFRDLTDKDFSMEQTLDIPGCSFYEVTSVVNFVEDYAVDYNVTVEVTGEWIVGRNRTDMTAEQLKEKVDSIEGITHGFNKVAGNRNVAVTWATGSLTVSFGEGIDVKGVGAPIPNCIKY